MDRVAKYLNSVEIRHIRHFVAAAEHGSFRRAGAALGLSQSAVSRSIAELEDQIGASLFHRHTWGVSQTFAGQRFLANAKKALKILGESAHDVAAAGRGENGCVRIGIYSSIASGFLTELLRRYSDGHRKVQIEIVDGSANELAAAIRDLRLDVAFLTGEREWPECERAQLWSERVFIALPVSHPLGIRDKLTWSDLVGEAFVVSTVAQRDDVHAHIQREFVDLGRLPDIEAQSVGLDNLLPLVALGRGLTLVCEAMTATQVPGVIYRPILGEALPFSAVWSAKNDNPAFRRLLSLAKMIAVRSDL